MSLEAAIAELNKNLQVNNELLKKSLEGRAEILERAEKLTGKTAKADAEVKPSKSAKPAEKAEKSAAKPAKGKAPSEADVRKAFGEFMSVEDEDDREKRKEFVVAILDHLGVNKATEIAEGDRKKAIDWLAQKEDGKKVRFDDGEGADSDDEEDEDLI